MRESRRLVFETHATSLDNEAGLASGHHDVALSPDGRRQAAELGRRHAHPARELDPLRLRAIHTPFPGGQSYGDCVQQVRGVLDELRRNWPGGWVLIVAHRATHDALDVLVHGHTLEDLIQAPFTWQAGWAYELIPDGAIPSRQ